jgi:hypothetical protein
VVSASASIVNQVFVKFLSRLPHVASDLVRPAIPVAERMKTALSKLAGIAGDPAIGCRDPDSPLSFSCVTPEVRKNQLESLKFYAKDLDKAFSPLDAYGRPQRRLANSYFYILNAFFLTVPVLLCHHVGFLIAGKNIGSAESVTDYLTQVKFINLSRNRKSIFGLY